MSDTRLLFETAYCDPRAEESKYGQAPKNTAEPGELQKRDMSERAKTEETRSLRLEHPGLVRGRSYPTDR